MRSDLQARLELTIIAAGRGDEWLMSQDGIDTIINLTVNTNPLINMPDALDLFKLGYVSVYTNDLEIRKIIDIWLKNRYAGMTLEQFVKSVMPDANLYRDVPDWVPEVP